MARYPNLLDDVSDQLETLCQTKIWNTQEMIPQVIPDLHVHIFMHTLTLHTCVPTTDMNFFLSAPLCAFALLEGHQQLLLVGLFHISLYPVCTQEDFLTTL